MDWRVTYHSQIDWIDQNKLNGPKRTVWTELDHIDWTTLELTKWTRQIELDWITEVDQNWLKWQTEAQ